MPEITIPTNLLTVARNAVDAMDAATKVAFHTTLDAYLAGGKAFLPLADLGLSQRDIAEQCMTSQRKVSQALSLYKLQQADPTDFKAIRKAHTGSLAAFIAEHITEGSSSTPTKVTVKVVRERAKKDVVRLRKNWTPAQVRAYAEAILAELG